MLETCKKHGILSEKDFTIRIKNGKYRCVVCLICTRERYRNRLNKERDKINERRKELYNFKKNKERKPKICKQHGLIGIELQNLAHACKLCLKDYYQKNRNEMIAYNKNRRQEIKLNLPDFIFCKKHGKLSFEYINTRGKCKLCQKEYCKEYEEKNKEHLRIYKREYKRKKAHVDNAKRRTLTAKRKQELRSHWHPDTVKECIKHGLLKKHETVFVNFTTKGMNKKTTRCKYCKKEWQSKSEKRRWPIKSVYNRERSRENSKLLEDSYVKRCLISCGWSPESISNKVIELKRTVMKIKRMVKGNE